jgi:hypothetical protein
VLVLYALALIAVIVLTIPLFGQVGPAIPA